MDGLITRRALQLLAKGIGVGAHRRSLDDLMLRERMKAAIAEATSAWRADEVMPDVPATIRIRLPQQYTRGTEWMA